MEETFESNDSTTRPGISKVVILVDRSSALDARVDAKFEIIFLER